jgi:hypothetical protein
MSPLLVITVLFALSLSAAIILFKWLKNTAVVRLPYGHFGGAIAGFIGVFLILFQSYRGLDVQKDLQELRLPDTYTPYVSDTYGFAFGYPKKYNLKTQGPKTESLGTIDLVGSRAQVNVSVIRFDDTESFDSFRSNLGESAKSIPGVVNVTVTDYPVGGLHGKLLEAEPVVARPDVSSSKTLILPNPARKVAYLFSLSTCQNCQFTEGDFTAFRDILSTVQVTKR